jgi:hypothetical protein
MAVSIKIDPVEKLTVAAIRNDLALPEQRREAADFARAGLLEAQQVNRSILGRIPPHTTTVDGRADAPLDSVNPSAGRIVFEFELIGDLLRWIADTLVARSPAISGRYKRGHTILANGQEILVGAPLPAAADEFVFLNPIPYARKIEVGKTKAGRAFVMQVPNRIYERTAIDARRRFGNLADIRFAFRDVTGAYQLRRSAGRGRSRRAGGTVQAPAIIVSYRKA